MFFFFLVCFLFGSQVYRTYTWPSQWFLSIQFSGVKYVHIVGHLSPPCTSRTFFLVPNGNSAHNTRFLFPTPSSPWQPPISSLPLTFQVPHVRLHSICPFVTGSFHLARRPQGPSLCHMSEWPCFFKALFFLLRASMFSFHLALKFLYDGPETYSGLLTK